MKFVNVREARLHFSELLDSKEDVVVTRYGKPIKRLVAVPEVTYADLAREMGKAFRDAGITKKEALAALEDVRKEARLKRPRRR